jgi:predicted porin
MNKKLVAAAVGAALAAPTAVQAVKYKLSGQINRVIQWQDDGVSSDVQFYDNDASSSRWRMVGSEDIGNGVKVGFNWEWSAQSNKGSAPMKSPGTGFSQELRRSEVWFSSSWGKLALGKGSGAGDGTTEMDLSSTWNASAYVARSSAGAATAWRTSSGATLPGGITHGATGTYWDAFGRYDRLRYDTPALGPVTASVSVGQDDRAEVGLRWSQGIAAGQLSAGLFYGKTKGVDDRYGGSLAYLFSQGTNLAFTYTTNNPSTAPGTPSVRGDQFYGKVAHNWGNNSASFGYGSTEDAVPGFTDSGFNIGFNHNIPKAKVDLYASYHFNQLDTPATVASVEDLNIVLMGTKLKFD